MKILFRSAPALLAGLLIIALLASCGGGSYVRSVQSIMNEISDNNDSSISIDFKDPAAVTKYCSKTKAIYQKLIDLKAPDKYSEAQSKYAAAANAMFDYLAGLPEYCAMDDSNANKETARKELQNKYVTVLQDLTAGNTITGAQIKSSSSSSSGKS